MNQQNVTPQQLWEQLSALKNKKVIMTLHQSPDGDSLGSSVALKYILEKNIGATVRLISADNLTLNLSLKNHVEFGPDLSEINFDDYDALVCIDESSNEVLSPKKRKEFLLPTTLPIFNIDHHPTNTFYGTYNYVLSDASSACEVLLDLARQWRIEIDQSLATALMVGLTTDTGFYKFINNSKVFKDAGFLMDQGVDYRKQIMEPLLYDRTLKDKQFIGLIYSNIKYIADKQFYYVAITKQQWQKLNLSEDDISGAAPTFADIADADFVFSLIEVEGGVKGSFRSRKVDVSQIAQTLGGGGHKAAAGLFLANMGIQEAEQLVLKTIKELALEPLS